MSDAEAKEKKEQLNRWDRFDEASGIETAGMKAKRELAERWWRFEEMDKQRENQYRSKHTDPEGYSTLSQPVLRPRRWKHSKEWQT